MPSFCGVINCGNRRDREYMKRFFRLPAARVKGCQKVIGLSRIRRKKWLLAIRRADLTETKMKYLTVCQDHFISGQPGDLLDTENPDWVPSQKMGYTCERKTENVHEIKVYWFPASSHDQELRKSDNDKCTDHCQPSTEYQHFDIKMQEL